MREAKILVLALTLVWAGAAKADETIIEPGLITWEVQSGESTLRISSPDGTVEDLLFVSGENPFFSIFDQSGELIPDGQYNWELLVQTPGATRRVPATKPATRNPVQPAEPISKATEPLSGAFRVLEGAFVAAESTESFQKDEVIPDDLIVQGHLCVGLDCQPGEPFGDDTIRLKDRDLRVKFEDTSFMGNFSTNDWQITINDSTSGGQDRFSIDDVDGESTPFTLEGSAPSHSLYVDDIGRVGFGTSVPATDLHVKTGITPALRIEQDASNNLTPQTWDLAGNETHFFIRDVTNSSALPFRVRSGAPDSALDIAGTTGNVGMGTPTPSTSLHIKRTTGLAKILVEEGNATTTNRNLLELKNSGGVFLRLTNSEKNEWDLLNAAGGGFQISRAGSGKVEFVLGPGGDLFITGGLVTATPAGTCNPGPCDGIFQPEYQVESIEEHAEFMWENSYLWGVGPTREGESMNLTKKTAGILHELEKAHIYIEELHNKAKVRDVEIVELRERLEKIERLLERAD